MSTTTLINTPKITYRKDYTPPAYLVDSLDLHFTLGEAVTLVKSRIQLVKNSPNKNTALRLDGKHLTLKSIRIDGKELASTAYAVEADHLTITTTPERFLLEIETEIKPQENTALEGLYKSSGNFCTQCEAHGFSRITYYLDRPDVMTRFTTTIVADQERYPVLLSNGNLIDSGKLEHGQHFAVWQDPFKKPCYLFALVAGKLACITDSFTTQSGRQVALKLYVEPGNEDKCQHAMAALKKAMRWDEEVFGREYDLDIFMIVAVSDFNMGAMENKGLNIFNSQYILANPKIATDSDFEGIETVVAHEYFHNWTGDRVTCRDWFQLSLKEGLTVFRDQEFTADVTSRAVTRIDDVRILRSTQFPQDAGPLAHPVRPESYIEMNNFYTVTVYNKGAEVIRMQHTLLGATGFRKGMDLYFARHDGQAVTCDDFVKAMEDANGADLQQFRLWYSQAGTPELVIKSHYQKDKQLYTLAIQQTCPPTPGQPQKKPMTIPLALALLDKQGKEIPLSLADEAETAASLSRVFAITEKTTELQFTQVSEQPVPSLLRNFSAPVKLNYDYTDDELCFLLAHDEDAFGRWEAGQQLAVREIMRLIKGADHPTSKAQTAVNPALIAAYRQALEDTQADPALIAQVLTLPSETFIGEQLVQIPVQSLVAARKTVRDTLAQQLAQVFYQRYKDLQSQSGAYQYNPQAVGQRSLKNVCLSYLMVNPTADNRKLCLQQFQQADNMTDELAALRALANADCGERLEALDAFYRQWQHEALVVDKWLAIQASAELPGTYQAVCALLKHPAFTLQNPNKVRALLGSFCRQNFMHFHAADGSGYQLLAEYILQLNNLNPQIAARMLEPLTQWQRFTAPQQQLMQEQLTRIVNAPKLSKDVYELAAKALGMV